MELIYRVELDLETDASGAIEGDGMLFYAVSDVDLSSVLSVSGSRDGSAVELTLSFEEELNDLTLMGEQVASDRVEGDCAAGVAEGDFQLYR